MLPLSHMPLSERVETVRKLAAAAAHGQALFEFWPVFYDLDTLQLPQTRPTLEALAELTAQGHDATKLLLAVYEVELSTLLEFVDADNLVTRAALEALIQADNEAWARYEAESEAERARLAAMNADERAAYEAQQLEALKALARQGRKR